jgi:hypothetical protein
MTTAQRRPWSDRTTRVLAWAAVAWTVAVGLALLAVPTGTSVGAASSGVGSTGSEVVTTTSHETLLEHEGAGVVALLLVPVVVALAGALGRGATVRRRRIAAGGVLAVACLLGAMTLGIFYVPAAALLLTAGLKART